MGYYRRNRYRNRAYRRGPLRGIAGLVFLVFLFLAFSGHFFLPLLFIGLAFASLLGSISTLNPRGLYGGVQGFIWFLGLALCFAIGFWPWILLPIILSAFLGVLIRPIMAMLLGLGIFGAASMMNQGQQPPAYQQPYPYYQPSQPQEQPPIYQDPNSQPYQQPYEPYQQGYQSPPQPSTYQAGEQQYYYPPNESPQQQQYNQGQSYEEPQAQYPQEMPPPQQ